MRTFWRCTASLLPILWPGVDCAAHGDYLATAMGGDAGPAAKHTKTTGHPTETSLREWWA